VVKHPPEKRLRDLQYRMHMHTIYISMYAYIAQVQGAAKLCAYMLAITYMYMYMARYTYIQKLDQCEYSLFVNCLSVSCPIVRVYIHTHTHTHIQELVRCEHSLEANFLYIYIYIYIYTHTHIYTYIHIHIYTHMYTHTHTC
jgi:hypothetical protein